MFEDGTEPPNTSILNNEKREGSYYCANCGIKLFESLQNMKVDPVGPHFINHCQMFLKLKRTIY